MIQCGERWQNCPSDDGPSTTICDRWRRWRGRGVWRRLLARLSAQGPLEELAMLDATYVKARRSALAIVRHSARRRISGSGQTTFHACRGSSGAGKMMEKRNR